MPDWQLTQTFKFRGLPVRYDVLGPDDAPGLVLLHGTPFSSRVWRRIAPWLAGRFRVHVYDMLGYGASAKGDLEDVSLGVQNGLLAALLDHWRLGRPHVVAHDFGGATALRAHFLDGAAYASLTLIDPVAIRPQGSPFVVHARQHEAAFAGMPAYAHAALLDAYLRTAVAGPAGAADVASYAAPWLGEAGQIAFYRQIAQMDPVFTDAVEPLYPTLRCPVQLLWGTEDRWIPIETGRRLAAMLPEARFVEVPGAGHLVQEDAPEAIVAALAGFEALGWHRAAPG